MSENKKPTRKPAPPAQTEPTKQLTGSEVKLAFQYKGKKYQVGQKADEKLSEMKELQRFF